jgi:hypothetical protein
MVFSGIARLPVVLMEVLTVMFPLTAVGGVTGKMPNHFSLIEMPRSPTLISMPAVFWRSDSPTR